MICSVLACTWDVVTFVAILTLHWAANRQDSDRTDVEATDSNVQLLATACTGGIVAVSILASAGMLLLTGDRLPNADPNPICDPVFRALFWYLASLFMGLCVLSLLPMFAPSTDPRRRSPVIVSYFGQFLALAIGAIWLLKLIWTLR